MVGDGVRRRGVGGCGNQFVEGIGSVGSSHDLDADILVFVLNEGLRLVFPLFEVCAVLELWKCEQVGFPVDGEQCLCQFCGHFVVVPV